ncbi:MAG TPA: hypothetical protein VGK78_16005 [Nocardioides sp.]|uniref:hypothetical protein n=1 Tax=Nocardioides sp. TaxID=35761 RepID=UPI002F3F87C5
MHVGGGRTGFSTGVGPVSYYTSGYRGGTSSRSRSRTGTATTNRQLAAATRAAEKQEQAQALAQALLAILNVHRAQFDLAQRPIAPAPPPIDVAAFRTKHVKEAKASTSIFARSARKAALEEAERRAQADASELAASYEQERVQWQASLDEQWAALNANDPDTVLTVLADAFEDNEAAAAAVGVDGSEVTLVVVVPAVSSVPERKPTTTSAGNLSLKKLTKRETADMYKQLVCGQALVTVKEAFAVAPALTAARIVAMRAAAPDAYGKIRAEVVLAARFARSRLDGIQWDHADAAQIVNDASTERILIQKGAVQELMPVDLSREPQLKEVVDAVDFEELV